MNSLSSNYFVEFVGSLLGNFLSECLRCGYTRLSLRFESAKDGSNWSTLLSAIITGLSFNSNPFFLLGAADIVRSMLAEGVNFCLGLAILG